MEQNSPYLRNIGVAVAASLHTIEHHKGLLATGIRSGFAAQNEFVGSNHTPHLVTHTNHG